MTNPSLALYLLIAVTGFIVGISKGGLGSALGAIATPLLTLVLPAPIALGTALSLFLVGDLFAIWTHWGGWDRRIILKVMPGTILGVIVASILLDKLPALTIQRTIAVLSLAYCAYKLIERRLRQRIVVVEVANGGKPWYASAFGMGSGFASTVGNVGGPVFTVYLLTLELVPETFAATAALYFALVNLMKIPGYLSAHILNPEVLVQFIWVIPIIFIGVRLGKVLDRYLDMHTFETLIIILLAVTAVFLLVKA